MAPIQGAKNGSFLAPQNHANLNATDQVGVSVRRRSMSNLMDALMGLQAHPPRYSYYGFLEQPPCYLAQAAHNSILMSSSNFALKFQLDWLQKELCFSSKSQIGAADAAAGETPAPPFLGRSMHVHLTTCAMRVDAARDFYAAPGIIDRMTRSQACESLRAEEGA